VTAGVIDCTLDGLPAVQRLPHLPGVLHAGGWCGHGVALSLASGAWVAELLGRVVLRRAFPGTATACHTSPWRACAGWVSRPSSGRWLAAIGWR